MEPRVTSTVKFIQENISRELSLKEMADEVNLSPAYLSMLFKTETGMTPLRYRKKLRLLEARRLLETTFLTVHEIMLRVGIKDDSHFVRDFKKLYGLTPGQHRANYLQQQNTGTVIPITEDSQSTRTVFQQ